MILTTMTPGEILREYKKDYPELKRRMLTYLKVNNSAFIRRFKKTGEELITIPNPRSTVINGNRYKVWIDIYCGKNGFKTFNLYTYQVLADTRSGKLRIWLITPSREENDKILEFKPEFIKRLFPGDPIKEAIDKFMRQFKSYIAYRKPDSETYNFEASFGDNLVGFGYEDDCRFSFDRVYTFKEIEEMGKELGLDGNIDPLNTYNLWLKHKEEVENSEKDISVDDSELSEEEKKKLEIEKAWKEYGNI